MKTAIPLPDDFQGRPFTVAEAAAAGVSSKRLRHRSLAALGRGIRSLDPMPGLPLSVRVRPFIEVSERCAASHLTAAELGSLPARQAKEGPEMYHVIRPEGAAHLNRPHVIVHRMKLYDDEVTLLDGIPITTPERTWLDLAEMLSVDELVVAGDSCVRERYTALGWTEVRISKRHMQDDAKAAVAKVRTALVRAGWRPGR